MLSLTKKIGAFKLSGTFSRCWRGEGDWSRRFSWRKGAPKAEGGYSSILERNDQGEEHLTCPPGTQRGDLWAGQGWGL